MDMTQFRDLSLGAVAILAMAWLLGRIMQWQLEERRTWTAKVEDWGKQQRDDKVQVMALLERVTGVMQRLTDEIDADREERAEQRKKMADTVSTLQKTLDDHRAATERKGKGH